MNNFLFGEHRNFLNDSREPFYFDVVIEGEADIGETNYEELSSAYMSGKLPVAHIQKGDGKIISAPLTSFGETLEFIGTTYDKAIVNVVLSIDDVKADYTEIEAGEYLPEVTSGDNGDVLTVVEGEWRKAEIPSELPAVTGSDNGDVLQVVEGAWAKVTPPNNVFEVTYTISDGDTPGSFVATTETLFADFQEAIKDRKEIKIYFDAFGSLKGVSSVYYYVENVFISATIVINNSGALQAVTVAHSSTDVITPILNIISAQ